MVGLQGARLILWAPYSNEPSPVPEGLGDIVEISSQWFHKLGLRADGTVVGWGPNEEGEADVPEGLSDVVAIAAGRAHSLALKADGMVVAWGSHNTARLTFPGTWIM